MGVEQRPEAASADPAELERLYLAMLRSRLFEDAVLRLFMANEVEGTTHLCQGEQAVSRRRCAVLEPGETVAATYRGQTPPCRLRRPWPRPSKRWRSASVRRFGTVVRSRAS